MEQQPKDSAQAPPVEPLERVGVASPHSIRHGGALQEPLKDRDHKLKSPSQPQRPDGARRVLQHAALAVDARGLLRLQE
eukprot:CAMPEP_0171128296 /NCGR_PEP_ID=MMETSP0766_2-20121228/116830_1 /TAXON_ID=439317 /ORGANISM="Gambierdiscus australes, Strain CAWD 149" /LENGTH=78 /DNA_ID=CAMNT_0011591451 /DNA_START=156 /DNA_END=389 /DNA_ORIENTATION=+